MARPETIEDLVKIEQVLLSLFSRDKKLEPTNCKSCESKYPLLLRELTEGYCHSCAAEVFYGDVSSSVSSVLKSNEDNADKEFKFHNALAPRQRYGKTKTNS